MENQSVGTRKNKKPLDENRNSCKLYNIEIRNQFTAG
jgi:hypothetical protein